MLALSAGLGVSTWSFINERKARQSAATAATNATAHARIAEEQRGVADQMRRESKQLADTLESTLTRADRGVSFWMLLQTLPRGPLTPPRARSVCRASDL